MIMVEISIVFEHASFVNLGPCHKDLAVDSQSLTLTNQSVFAVSLLFYSNGGNLVRYHLADKPGS